MPVVVMVSFARVLIPSAITVAITVPITVPVAVTTIAVSIPVAVTISVPVAAVTVTIRITWPYRFLITSCCPPRITVKSAITSSITTTTATPWA